MPIFAEVYANNQIIDFSFFHSTLSPHPQQKDPHSIRPLSLVYLVCGNLSLLGIFSLRMEIVISAFLHSVVCGYLSNVLNSLASKIEYENQLIEDIVEPTMTTSFITAVAVWFWERRLIIDWNVNKCICMKEWMIRFSKALEKFPSMLI